MLTKYITQVRRRISDPNAQYWSDSELTDDINDARVRIAGDTKCLRQVITNVTLPTGQELYNIPTTLNGGTPANMGLQALEVYSVTIYWGNMRVICQNRSFTEQNAKLRIFQNYTTRPGSLAIVGGSSAYINPVPDQPYSSDWDVVFAPLPLVSDATVETLPTVFQPLVQWYAAHLAKYNDQSLTEANDVFYKKYIMERAACMYHFFSMRFRDAYRR